MSHVAHAAIFPPEHQASVFPTEVREAADVVRRGALYDAFHQPQWSETLARVDRDTIPSADELEHAARTLERACYEYLRTREGERLDAPIRTEVYQGQAWSTPFVRVVRKPPLTVCYGRPAAQLRSPAGELQWVLLSGRDGCGVVYRGRVAGRVGSAKPLCPDCQRVPWPRRRERLEAVWRANDAGRLEYPVFYADGTTAVVRIGHCKCGSQFQTKDVRQTRCDRCRSHHR